LSESRQQIIRSVPAELKSAIAERVETDGTNMNDLLVGILAQYYDVRFEPSGRASAVAIGDSSDIVLRMPKSLKKRIGIDAERQEREKREIMIDAIADGLGVSAAA
jgi:hypothetical protein